MTQIFKGAATQGAAEWASEGAREGTEGVVLPAASWIWHNTHLRAKSTSLYEVKYFCFPSNSYACIWQYFNIHFPPVTDTYNDTWVQSCLAIHFSDKSTSQSSSIKPFKGAIFRHWQLPWQHPNEENMSGRNMYILILNSTKHTKKTLKGEAGKKVLLLGGVVYGLSYNCFHNSTQIEEEKQHHIL